MDYPSNSNKSKNPLDPGPRTTCVVKSTDTGTPKRKGILDVFIAKDVNEIKDYLIYELIIPKVKETIQDTIDMMFWGGTNHARPHSGGTKIYRQTDYNSISTYNNRRPANEDPLRASRRSDTVVYKQLTAAEAQQACDDLVWNCQRYGKARLEEYYQLVGLPTVSTDHNWGWTNLDGLKPRREGLDTWIVPVPAPIPID